MTWWDECEREAVFCVWADLFLQTGVLKLISRSWWGRGCAIISGFGVWNYPPGRFYRQMDNAALCLFRSASFTTVTCNEPLYVMSHYKAAESGVHSVPYIRHSSPLCRFDVRETRAYMQTCNLNLNLTELTIYLFLIQYSLKSRSTVARTSFTWISPLITHQIFI